MSMEVARSSTLTSMQREFVNQIIKGRDKNEAGIAAGYQPDNVSIVVWNLLQLPQIIGAIQIGVARDLAIGSAVANRVLQQFVADETLDKRLRVVCAKTILDRAGHIAPKAVAASQGGSIPLNEMSMADLRQLADKLEGEIAGRAKEVSSANAAPDKAQTIEDIM